MVYVALTSSIGRCRTGPIAAGLEGFDGGGVLVTGGLEVGGGVVIGLVDGSLSLLLLLLVFCWLVSPLSAAAMLSAGVSPPWEQQFPMVEGREVKQKWVKERERKRENELEI